MVALKMNPPELQQNAVVEIGVATRALAGQSVSGDVYVVCSFEDGVLLAVIDGSGHGAEATVAATAAANVLEQHAHESVIRLAQRCHEALLPTRGAAMTLVSVHATHNTFEWLGVGNVEGFHFRADTAAAHPTAVLLRGGIVGYQMPPLRATVATIARGDALVLATDGIRSDFSVSVNLNDSPQRIATCVLTRHLKGTDDGLVLVARYRGGDDE